MPAYRLLGVRSAAPVRAGGRTPLVGRDEELATLRRELDARSRIGECAPGGHRWSVGGRRQVAPGRGVPGVVVPEGRPSSAAAASRTGRASRSGRSRRSCARRPTSSTTTRHDAARAKIDALADDDRAAAERVAAAVGLTDADFPVDELFWGVRSCSSASPRTGPLVVAFEDHPLGGADHARPGRAPRRDVRLRCSSCARRVTRSRREGDAGPPGPAGRSSSSSRSRPRRPPSGRRGRGPGDPPGNAAGDRRGRGRQPALRGADARDAPGRAAAATSTVPPTISALLRPGSTGSATRSARSIGTASVVGQVFPEAGRRRARAGHPPSAACPTHLAGSSGGGCFSRTRPS